MAIHVDDSQFETEVLNADTPVLVDFWATWCAPCRAIEPVIEKLSQEYEGRVKFCKVNVDENQKTTMKYGIRSIPTLILFKDGNIVDSIIGAVPASELKKMIDKHL